MTTRPVRHLEQPLLALIDAQALGYSRAYLGGECAALASEGREL